MPGDATRLCRHGCWFADEDAEDLHHEDGPQWQQSEHPPEDQVAHRSAS